jgi:hypothetical protein
MQELHRSGLKATVDIAERDILLHLRVILLGIDVSIRHALTNTALVHLRILRLAARISSNPIGVHRILIRHVWRISANRFFD